MSVPGVQVGQCFPLSKKYDAPCAPKPENYAFVEQFGHLMALSHYRMLGGSVQSLKDYIERAFMEEEKAEMHSLITIANDPKKMVDFLSQKFFQRNREEIESEVFRIHNNLRSKVSTEHLKVYGALRLVEDAPAVVKPYAYPGMAGYEDPCLGL